MVKGLLHDFTVARIGNRIQGCLGFTVGSPVCLGISRDMCRVGIDRVRESDFPVGSIVPVQEKTAHRTGVCQGRLSLAPQCMDLRQEHGGPHLVEFRAHLGPVKG